MSKSKKKTSLYAINSHERNENKPNRNMADVIKSNLTHIANQMEFKQITSTSPQSQENTTRRVNDTDALAMKEMLHQHKYSSFHSRTTANLINEFGY